MRIRLRRLRTSHLSSGDGEDMQFDYRIANFAAEALVTCGELAVSVQEQALLLVDVGGAHPLHGLPSRLLRRCCRRDTCLAQEPTHVVPSIAMQFVHGERVGACQRLHRLDPAFDDAARRPTVRNTTRLAPLIGTLSDRARTVPPGGR